jgi:hypothetical protein
MREVYIALIFSSNFYNMNTVIAKSSMLMSEFVVAVYLLWRQELGKCLLVIVPLQ